jgi:carotenoid cleavage dioxygenase-like enzyme
MTAVAERPAPETGNPSLDASEVVVVDAQRVEDGPPVARVEIPRRVPIGYHTWWVGADELESQRLAP